MSQEPAVLSAKTPELVSYLLEAGKTDSVYRDLYLQRARTLLASILPHSEYLRLKEERVSLDNLLRQSRAAVERGEWSKVKELTGRLRTLRHLVDEKHLLFNLGQAVYAATDVPLDPFSPGFQTLFAASADDLAATRARILEILSTLQTLDPAWREFYTTRRAHFEALSLDSLVSAPQAARPNPSQLQREALQALDKGDLDQLEHLAQEMLAPPTPPQVTLPTPQAVSATQMGVSVSFSEETLAGAQRLGLIPVRVGPAGELHEYLSCCCVWRATFPDRPLTEGGNRIKGCTCGHACPPSIPPALKENLDLLMVHPFINSGGVRYVPRFTAEHVLVEDFPEEEAHSRHSELLSALGLKQRTAVSRVDIELALLQQGPQLVKDKLGLDPREFCLLCIPFDLYCRLGPKRGWGQRRLWTHLDGYQLLEGGKLRALVGGDVRYGGIYDLCSISRVDGREGVTTRFAVVRRERLAAA